MAGVAIQEALQAEYPGRGIIVGRTLDGKKAAIAYFIMGRSENSRNRIFVEDGDGIRTQAFDASRVSDSSLIIYAPVRVMGNKTIITNGDQTDTIYAGMDRQLTFEQALRSRTYEPDAPNYTPRISSVVRIADGKVNYALSIIKRASAGNAAAVREMFAYEDAPLGEGRLIHTYEGNGAGENGALASFTGEPRQVLIETDDLDDFTSAVWASLNSGNKVSLFTRFIDIASGGARCGCKYDSRIVNKNE